MSAAPRAKGSWWLLNYDRLVLTVVAVLLLVSAITLLARLGGARQSLQSARQVEPGVENRQVQAMNLVGYEKKEAEIGHPYQAPRTARRLMVSEMRVACIKCGQPIPYAAMTCPFCKAQQPVIGLKQDSDQDGLPDDWEVKYGLNPVDLSDAQGDLDQDGFTNLEEFNAETNPTDAGSSPDPVAKLRVLQVGTVPFLLRFQGISRVGDRDVFQLNLRKMDRTYFARLDEPVDAKDFPDFKVVEFLPNSPKGPTVVLQQGNKTVRLVKDQVVTQDDLRARLISLIDRGVRLQLALGAPFTVKDVDYKVIDIKRDGVLIRNVQTGKDTMITPLSETEKILLQASASSISPTPAPVIVESNAAPSEATGMEVPPQN